MQKSVKEAMQELEDLLSNKKIVSKHSEENSLNFDDLLSDKKKVSSHVEKEASRFDELQGFLSKERKISSEISRNFPSAPYGQALILCNAENNFDVMISVLKKVSIEKKFPVLILTSTNYKSMQKMLSESHISSDFYIIDAVSKNLSDTKETEKILFVDSLRNLTQIQIRIINLIEKEKEIVFIFDSLNVLELYHSEIVIFKFIYSVAKIMRKNKIDCFYILNKKSLVPKLSQFFDNFVEIKKSE